MPIYDYRCQGCRRRISLLFQTFAAAEHAKCPHCGSAHLSRLITRFAVMKSEDSRLDDVTEAAMRAGYAETVPQSVARWARQMGREFGDDLGDDYDEMIDRMEAGELPDDEDGGDFGGDLGDDIPLD
jgi:putative FmdB family regulatory protein